MRDSFIFYKSFYDALRELPDEDRHIVMDAILDYQFGDNTFVLTGIPKTIFILIKPQLDANNRRYENGSKGGRPPKENQTITKPKPRNNPDVTKPEPNKNENENVNEKDNENISPLSTKRVPSPKTNKPDDVDQEIWDGWKNLRKQKRAPISELVLKQIRKECENVGWNLQQALSECCNRGWAGFKADWVENARANPSGHGKTGNGHQTGGQNAIGEAGKAIAINERIKAGRLKNFGQSAPPERIGGPVDTDLRPIEEIW